MDDKIIPEITPDPIEKARLEAAIFLFNIERASKSYSGRHPELGRMVNCPVCDKRHRAAHVCLPRYAKTEDGVERLAMGFRRPKGRINRHPNKRNLQLIQRTQELYPKYSVRMKPINAMKCARAEAARTLQAERKANRK